MIYFVIIGCAGLYGISQLPRIKDKLTRIILWGQIVSIGLVFVQIIFVRVSIISISSTLLFMLTLALAIYYGVTKKGLVTRKRYIIIIPASFILVKYIFMIQHYPGANLINLAMVIPLLTYLIGTLTNRNNFKNELGFLTIIATEALLALLHWSEHWWK